VRSKAGFVALLAAAFLAVPVLGLAAQGQGVVLESGKYMAVLTPPVDEAGAASIDKELRKLKELESVSVQSSDSTVHFTVKSGKKLDASKLEKTIMKGAPEIRVLGTPQLETEGSVGPNY